MQSGLPPLDSRLFPDGPEGKEFIIARRPIRTVIELLNIVVVVAWIVVVVRLTDSLSLVVRVLIAVGGTLVIRGLFTIALRAIGGSRTQSK